MIKFAADDKQGAMLNFHIEPADIFPNKTEKKQLKAAQNQHRQQRRGPAGHLIMDHFDIQNPENSPDGKDA